MITIEEKKSILFMQYALESLIEDYNKAELESDKYYVKLRLIEYIEKSESNISKMTDYMSLQEGKFRPFISLLCDVKQSKVKNRDYSSDFSTPTNKVKVLFFEEA